ncbi:MAG: hypothetical protein K0Q53_1176 [Massilibacillus sp.]|nr:hypothetical protein [Massilibacillus sp.]
MEYNQELSRNDRASVRKSLRVSQENKLISTNNLNIAKNIKTVCAIKMVFLNSIKNNRIVEKLWVQC